MTAEPTWVTRPLRSTRIARFPGYYGTLRPCASLRYSSPCGFLRLEFSLSGCTPPSPGIAPYRGSSRVGRGNLTPSRSQNRAYPSRSTRLVASMQPCPAAGRPYKLFPLKVVGPIGLPWTPRPLGSTRITELPSYYEAVRPCALRSVLYLSLVHNLRISHHGRASSSKPTTPIAGRVPRGQPSSFRVTGSPVPHQSPSQARAAFMPDAVWAVSRCLPDCSRERNPTLGFDVV